MNKYFKSELQSEMRKWFKEKRGYIPYNQVYAEIKGTPLYLNETEVRFLQVKCKQEAEQGRFEQFCKDHVVYSGRTKRGHEPMRWRADGNFINKFKPGFYNSCMDLIFEIV